MEKRRVDKRFYSSEAWRRLRAYKLVSDPLCEDCKDQGLITAASEVHHRIKRKASPELAMDLDNLVSLCTPCHSARTARGQ
jgi:5-methylcytosine-specific restriction enzyme A